MSSKSQFSLEYTHKVIFQDVPLAWTTRFELFTPDLEQFPLMYIHRLIDNERVFGFPVAINSSQKTGKFADIEVTFLCNRPQGNGLYDSAIRDELANRIGLSNAVEIGDLDSICVGKPQYKDMLLDLWDGRIDKVYGGKIPHGRIYDEIFGIVRFSASGVAPRLGKTSELRMTYWFMKEMGEPVSISGGGHSYEFCEFYLLPSMEETRNSQFQSFPRFGNLVKSLRAFWDLEFPDRFRIHDLSLAKVSEIKSELKKRNLATKGKKDELWARLEAELNANPKISNSLIYRSAPNGGEELPAKSSKFEERYQRLLVGDYDTLDLLRQIFNRNAQRMYGFVWNLMTYIENGFENFTDRDQFKDILLYHHKRKGFSSKVLACILQQCFGFEAMPIDTWVKTFLLYPVGLNPTDSGKGDLANIHQLELYNNFRKLDKLEKIIWVSSMGNKTNKTEFRDVLWCQRYGTDLVNKGPCRGANPLSCSKCALTKTCLGYAKISSGKLVINSQIRYLDLSMLVTKTDMERKSIPKQEGIFGVLLENDVPRAARIYVGKNIAERDHHSGYEFSISDTLSKLDISNIDTVSDFVDHFS